jgi:ribosome-binding factor A
MARVIIEAVSDIIRNHLQDPRIEGLVSVTEVKVTPDMKNAHVYLSILGAEGVEKRTFSAIEHAVGYIQSLLGQRVISKFCPHLTFHIDDRLKRSAETMRIIDEVLEKTNQNDIGNAEK